MALPQRARPAKPGSPSASARLQGLRRCAKALFIAMAFLCATGFVAIFMLPRPWIPSVLVGSWVCIGAAALALLAVHVIPGRAESADA